MREFSTVEAVRHFDTVVQIFNDLGIEHVLIGGLALSVWGRPRMTLDIDFLAMVDESGLKRFSKMAHARKISVDRKWLKWNPMLRGLQLRLRFGRLAIDVLAPRDAHDRQAIQRRKRKRMGKCFYNLVSPEDLILQKLKVGRPRDFEDAVTVLERMRGKLDMPYVRRWARQLGILGELNYVVRL